MGALSFDAAGVRVVLRDDGILVYEYNMPVVDEQQAVATLEAAEQRLKAEGVRLPRPTLVFPGPVTRVTRNARTVFAESEQNARLSSRVAMVTPTSATRIIGEFFRGFNRNHREVRLFGDEKEAIAWLLEGRS